jgi:hypothetical protein
MERRQHRGRSSYLRPPRNDGKSRFMQPASAYDGYLNEENTLNFLGGDLEKESIFNHNRLMIVGYLSCHPKKVFTIPELISAIPDAPDAPYCFAHLKRLEAEGLVRQIELNSKVRLKHWQSLAPPLPDVPILIADLIAEHDEKGILARNEFHTWGHSTNKKR